MTLTQLHAEYLAQRLVKLTEAEFGSLLSYAPVLMVAASDQNVDHLEMGYLTGLLAEQTLALHKPHAEGADREQLLQVFIDEFKYLLYHLEPWEDKFLTVLANELVGKQDLKEKLRVQMVAMALASRGINEYERQKIYTIADRLSMTI